MFCSYYLRSVRAPLATRSLLLLLFCCLASSLKYFFTFYSTSVSFTTRHQPDRMIWPVKGPANIPEILLWSRLYQEVALPLPSARLAGAEELLLELLPWLSQTLSQNDLEDLDMTARSHLTGSRGVDLFGGKATHLLSVSLLPSFSTSNSGGFRPKIHRTHLRQPLVPAHGCLRWVLSHHCQP